MPCTNSFGVIAERNENLNVGKVKNAMACSQKCLEHKKCEIYSWISPEWKKAKAHEECWLMWDLTSDFITNKNIGVIGNTRNCTIKKWP